MKILATVESPIGVSAEDAPVMQVQLPEDAPPKKILVGVGGFKGDKGEKGEPGETITNINGGYF